LNQDYKGYYEIIVVDNGSTDNTAQIARVKGVKVLYEIVKGPAASRNKGISHAKGELIAFIDSDCIAAPNWLTEIKNSFLTIKDASAIGGAIINPYPRSEVATAIHIDRFGEHILHKKNYARYVRTVPTCNICYSRHVFRKVTLFEESLVRSQDTYFNWQIVKRGDKIYFTPNVKVTHLHPRSFRSYLNKSYISGKYFVRTRRSDQTMLYSNFIKSRLLIPLLVPILFLGGFALSFRRFVKFEKINEKIFPVLIMIAIGRLCFGIGALIESLSSN
jgi:glycosyltransferase involved in cell wall biosynthesis